MAGGGGGRAFSRSVGSQGGPGQGGRWGDRSVGRSVGLLSSPRGDRSVGRARVPLLLAERASPTVSPWRSTPEQAQQNKPEKRV